MVYYMLKITENSHYIIKMMSNFICIFCTLIEMYTFSYYLNYIIVFSMFMKSVLNKLKIKNNVCNIKYF